MSDIELSRPRKAAKASSKVAISKPKHVAKKSDKVSIAKTRRMRSSAVITKPKTRPAPRTRPKPALVEVAPPNALIAPSGPRARFAVIDIAGDMAASELVTYAAAQQRQLREHFAPAYDGLGALDEVRVVHGVNTVANDEIPIFLYRTLPDGSPEGALGYHDRLLDGRPVIFIFRDLAIDNHADWRSIASHEVLEARADPRLHACVELDDGTIWDMEVCDRVESDSYDIDGVPMSNFNTPACFEPNTQKGAPREEYDFLNLSTEPNQVRAGGYAQKYDPQRGWTQVGERRGYRAELAELGFSRGVKREVRRAAFLECIQRDEREDDSDVPSPPFGYANPHDVAGGER